MPFALSSPANVANSATTAWTLPASPSRVLLCGLSGAAQAPSVTVAQAAASAAQPRRAAGRVNRLGRGSTPPRISARSGELRCRLGHCALREALPGDPEGFRTVALDGEEVVHLRAAEKREQR